LTDRVQPNLTGPSLFTALREQLGPQTRRAPAEIIVIDRIETTPADNYPPGVAI